MPRRLHVRITRHAISPRFATSTFRGSALRDGEAAAAEARNRRESSVAALVSQGSARRVRSSGDDWRGPVEALLADTGRRGRCAAVGERQAAYGRPARLRVRESMAGMESGRRQGCIPFATPPFLGRQVSRDTEYSPRLRDPCRQPRGNLLPSASSPTHLPLSNHGSHGSQGTQGTRGGRKDLRPILLPGQHLCVRREPRIQSGVSPAMFLSPCALQVEAHWLRQSLPTLSTRAACRTGSMSLIVAARVSSDVKMRRVPCSSLPLLQALTTPAIRPMSGPSLYAARTACQSMVVLGGCAPTTLTGLTGSLAWSEYGGCNVAARRSSQPRLAQREQCAQPAIDAAQGMPSEVRAEGDALAMAC